MLRNLQECIQFEDYVYNSALTVLARGKYETLKCDYGSRLATRAPVKAAGPVTREARRT